MDIRSKAKSAGDGLDALRADIDSLRSSLSDLTRHLGKAGANRAADVASEAKAAAGDVRHWVSDRSQVVGDAVKAQPLLACSVSLAAGAVLGALIMGRR